MTVDQITGKIFVIDDDGPEGLGTSVLRLPPNANGNEAGICRGCRPGKFVGLQVASDSTGKNLIEAHIFVCCESYTAGITTVVEQFPNGAALQAAFQVSGVEANGIADDPATKTYVLTMKGDASLNITGGIFRLAEDAVAGGPVENVDGPWTWSVRPQIVSTITSDTSGANWHWAIRATST